MIPLNCQATNGRIRTISIRQDSRNGYSYFQLALHKGDQEYKRSLYSLDVDWAEVDSVRAALEYCVEECKKLSALQGVARVYPEVTDDHAMAYIKEYGRILSGMRGPNPRLDARYVPPSERREERVREPREWPDIADIAAKWVADERLYDYTNVYNRPARMFML